jgi:hypothetical protein
MTSAETKVVESWDKDYLSRLAALSAREIALLKLKTDSNYVGETMTFPDGAGTAKVSVTTPYILGRTVSCSGLFDSAKYDFTVEVKLHPRHLGYSLAVCDDLDLKNDAKVLGDLAVNDVVIADTTAKVAGTVDLSGTRTLLYDVSEKVVSIDGQTSPNVTESVSDGNETLKPLGWNLANLKTLAVDAGQLYAGNQFFMDQTFNGVVYFTSTVTQVEFQDVSIKGVLVVEPAVGSPQVYATAGDTECTLIVKGGFGLKIIPDESIEKDLAVVAPACTLKVETNAVLEALGCVLVGYGDFASGCKGVVTGSTMVNGGVKCDGDLIFQAPAVIRETVPSAIVFTEFDIEELEYIEP